MPAPRGAVHERAAMPALSVRGVDVRRYRLSRVQGVQGKEERALALEGSQANGRGGPVEGIRQQECQNESEEAAVAKNGNAKNAESRSRRGIEPHNARVGE